MEQITIILTYLLKSIAPDLPPEVTLAIIGLLLAIGKWLYDKYIGKPKAVKQGITIGAVVTSGATHQEVQNTLGASIDKKYNVIEAYHAALGNNKVKQVDIKIDKAVKSIGGIGAAVTQAVDILKLISPFFPKKKK